MDPKNLTARLARTTTAAAALVAAGCGLFASRTLHYTPDEAPVSEVATTGGDTTYAFRTPTYWLLASHRADLWNRTDLDDVAWRYRWLFAGSPPLVAVRAAAPPPAGDSIGMWKGVVVVGAPLRRLPPATPVMQQSQPARAEPE